MKGLREFQIEIFRLGHKSHEFEYEITDKLFSLHEHSIVDKGRGRCRLVLDKSETMMTLQFEIAAEVELICDRSLDAFWHPIELKEEIIIKFGDDNYSLSDEVLVIKYETPSINVGDFIYEFINLAVPMKKLHPRYQDEEDDQPEIIYTSQEDVSEDDKEDQVDPRWEALKKLKGNK